MCKVTNTVSSSIFDDNIGEDGLSAQSMYDFFLMTPITKMPYVLIKTTARSHAIRSWCKEYLCISCAGNQQLIDANINEKYHDFKW